MFILVDHVPDEKIRIEFENRIKQRVRSGMNGKEQQEINRRASYKSIQEMQETTRQILENLRKPRRKPASSAKPGPTRVETEPAERPIATTEKVSAVDPWRVPAEDLLNAVAGHLSGKQVLVRYGEPESDNISASGTCRYLPDGSCRITISDTLTGAQSRFAVFLHECAHARFDGHRAAESLQVKNIREENADLQASIWQRFAEKHVYKFDSSAEPYYTKMLRALLTYTNPF